MRVWLSVAVCVMSVAAAEEVDPSLEWAPRSGGGAGLLAGQRLPDADLELEGQEEEEEEVRVAKRQAAAADGLDWQLMLEDGGGEARTRVKRGQLELNADEDHGDAETMQEESANDGGFDVSVDGDRVEEGPAEWLERRESPQLSSLSGSSGSEGKEEKGSGDEEEAETLDKNDAKPPK